MFRGNPIFASKASFLTQTLSRKDDMESVFYVLVFLLKSELPWKKKIQQFVSYEDTEKLKMQAEKDNLFGDMAQQWL